MSPKVVAGHEAGGAGSATAASYSRYALTNATFYTGSQVLQDYALVVERASIIDLVPSAQL
ncbi:MAG: hypothetical protein WBB18_18175, partial [Nodosilinea sp.]